MDLQHSIDLLYTNVYSRTAQHSAHIVIINIMIRKRLCQSNSQHTLTHSHTQYICLYRMWRWEKSGTDNRTMSTLIIIIIIEGDRSEANAAREAQRHEGSISNVEHTKNKNVFESRTRSHYTIYIRFLYEYVCICKRRICCRKSNNIFFRSHIVNLFIGAAHNTKISSKSE